MILQWTFGRLGLLLPTALALGSLGTLPELPPIDPMAETVDCWVAGTGFIFENCCHAIQVGSHGNPSCWTDGYTYELCCLPAIRRRIMHGFELVEAGSFREASDHFFKMYVFCFMEPEGTATRKAFPSFFGQVFASFEKAAKEFRRELEEYPQELSYFDILFSGMSIDCAPQSQAAGPYEDWVRCCHKQGLDHNMNCFHIFEMMANALGRSRRATASENAYYQDFSEQWAFHHFTPSMLGTSDVPDTSSNVQRAHEVDTEVAAALEAGGNPSLGIVWGNHVNYHSPQFEHMVYFVTSLLSRIRTEGTTGGIDILEIGAGYGTSGRVLASAKARLASLEKDPVRIESYTILDVRSVIDLQRWYLERTVGQLIDQRDWGVYSIASYFTEGLHELGTTSGAASLWPAGDNKTRMLEARMLEARLPINFVEPARREVFVHHFARSQGTTQNKRPVRALLAINSWHEFPMEEYLWYYNAFVVAPPSLSGVDWIVYVSNRAWDANDVKEALLLEPHPSFHFEKAFESCSVQTCFRILRRVS